MHASQLVSGIDGDDGRGRGNRKGGTHLTSRKTACLLGRGRRITRRRWRRNLPRRTMTRSRRKKLTGSPRALISNQHSTEKKEGPRPSGFRLRLLRRSEWTSFMSFIHALCPRALITNQHTEKKEGCSRPSGFRLRPLRRCEWTFRPSVGTEQ